MIIPKSIGRGKAHAWTSLGHSMPVHAQHTVRCGKNEVSFLFMRVVIKSKMVKRTIELSLLKGVKSTIEFQEA